MVHATVDQTVVTRKHSHVTHIASETKYENTDHGNVISIHRAVNEQSD